jgi:hypothetical protein
VKIDPLVKELNGENERTYTQTTWQIKKPSLLLECEKPTRRECENLI